MIYSYVTARVEDGAWSGVPRFDAALRQIVPELESVTSLPARLRSDDVVITDNHLSCDVPEDVPTIVVHHGCARAHWELVPSWRNESTLAMVRGQDRMFALRRRLYVAPSSWVMAAFLHFHPELSGDYATIIPHWVPRIDRRPTNGGPPRVIGDWRDENKGAGFVPHIASLLPGLRFEPLDFRTDAERHNVYGSASLYLCLSLSEGGAYAVADAEAASLPIVSTPVGNAVEFGAFVVPASESRNPWRFAQQIRHALATGRNRQSFYTRYTREVWARQWTEVIDRAHHLRFE